MTAEEAKYVKALLKQLQAGNGPRDARAKALKAAGQTGCPFCAERKGQEHQCEGCLAFDACMAYKERRAPLLVDSLERLLKACSK